MLRLLVAASACALLSAAAPPAINLVHVGGRVIEEPDHALSFGWPGIYFESRFEGPAMRLRFETATEHMRVLIDGEEKAVFREPGAIDLTIAGLPPGQHVARLEKLTESQSGGGRFIGFSFPGGQALPPQPRTRRIEFIGDSYTVGYGNRSAKRECTPDEVHDLTDTQQAFGPLLAKRLNADYRVNAYSGFGVVRNYGGSSPELNLPAIYPRLKPDIPAVTAAGEDGWHPALIVINLGTNDFSTPLKAEERWKTQDDLRADYRKRYIAFVDQLHRKHPQARFILMGSDAFIDDVRQIASLLRLSPGVAVRAVQFSELDLMGCDWHPSLADHRKLAELLQQDIAEAKIW
jgi:lysophospholipase L1-like esterase